MTDELLAIADELYALPLAEFTGARDARAKQLGAGRKSSTDLAKTVKALRKPSLAAWVVDLLARRDPEQVEQVLSVGAALREAQAAMAGDQLRALTRQRRQLTAAVTTGARRLAREHGVRVTDSVADQIEATLTAAILDEGCASAVRSGLLVAALSATGVDAVGLAEAVAVPAALGFVATAVDGGVEGEPDVPPALRVVADPDADAKELAAAREVVEAAQSELDDATGARDDAVSALSDLEARSLQVQAEIDELRRRIAELESTAEEVDDEIAEAEDTRDEAEAVVVETTLARDQAERTMARIRSSIQDRSGATRIS